MACWNLSYMTKQSSAPMPAITKIPIKLRNGKNEIWHITLVKNNAVGKDNRTWTIPPTVNRRDPMCNQSKTMMMKTAPAASLISL